QRIGPALGTDADALPNSQDARGMVDRRKDFEIFVAGARAGIQSRTTQLRPFDLARYSAWSAALSTSAGARAVASRSANPALIVTRTSPASLRLPAWVRRRGGGAARIRTRPCSTLERAASSAAAAPRHW